MINHKTILKKLIESINRKKNNSKKVIGGRRW